MIVAPQRVPTIFMTYHDQGITALALKSALAQPEQNSDKLKAIYRDVMEKLEIPALTIEAFHNLLDAYAKQQDREKLIHDLATLTDRL